jgi:hypothetical protein
MYGLGLGLIRTTLTRKLSAYVSTFAVFRLSLSLYGNCNRINEKAGLRKLGLN